MIAAPLAGHHLKVAAREGCGGTPAAKMDKEEFDAAVRQFLKALELAGVALPTDAIDVIDLFKKK